MQEDSLKQQRKQDALQKLAEWQTSFTNEVASRKLRNDQEAQEQKNVQDEAKNNNNPWNRVVENCEMNVNNYAGDKDVTRMRQCMISRKADIMKKGGME